MGAEDDISSILDALSEPTRLRLLDEISFLQRASASTLATRLPISRQAIVKHLVVLERDGIVTSSRSGREVLFEVHRDALDRVSSWLAAQADRWDTRLRYLKRRAEALPDIGQALAGGWTVLVMFGASGTGKSTAAAEIARRYGISWLQVDDLRLALQYSRVTLPERTEQLYFFEQTSDVWVRPVSELRRAFIDVAELLVPAVRVVIESHVVTNAPIVLEGDGILPALVDDPVLRPHVDAGVIRFCCVRADGVDEFMENLMTRGRGMDDAHEDAHRAQSAANEAFGAWLVEESNGLGIPVVASRPLSTLVDRTLAAIDPKTQSPS